jgi:hypothetical protein
MYILQPETPERSMFTNAIKAYKRRDFFKSMQLFAHSIVESPAITEQAKFN